MKNVATYADRRIEIDNEET